MLIFWLFTKYILVEASRAACRLPILNTMATGLVYICDYKLNQVYAHKIP
jgi:hypothetical protein